MELTSGQRKALFALVVAALIALGTYMFVPGARAVRAGASTPAAGHSPALPPRPAARTSAPAPSSPAPSSPAPATAPDIYQWLPFSQAGLTSAASVVTQFGNAYGTFSYTENAAAYVRSMQNLISPELAQVLASDYSVPGVASERTSKKQVSAGTAVIDSLRAFGPSSITFVVTINREVTDTSGRRRASARYAVTVTGVGTSWQVNDIELSGVGNT
jgi:hypothetical protein